MINQIKNKIQLPALIVLVIVAIGFWQQPSGADTSTCNFSDSAAQRNNIPDSNQNSGSAQPSGYSPSIEIEVANDKYSKSVNSINNLLSKDSTVSSVAKGYCESKITTSVKSKDLKRVSKKIISKGQLLHETTKDSESSNALDTIKKSIANYEKELKDAQSDSKNNSKNKSKSKQDPSQDKQIESLKNVIKQQQSQLEQIQQTETEGTVEMNVIVQRSVDSKSGFLSTTLEKTKNLFSSFLAVIIFFIPLSILLLATKKLRNKNTAENENR